MNFRLGRELEDMDDQLRSKGISAKSRWWLVRLYYGVTNMMNGDGLYPKSNYNKIRLHMQCSKWTDMEEIIIKSGMFDVFDDGFRSRYLDDTEEELDSAKNRGRESGKKKQGEKLYPSVTDQSSSMTQLQSYSNTNRSRYASKQSRSMTPNNNNKYNYLHDNNKHEININNKHEISNKQDSRYTGYNDTNTVYNDSTRFYASNTMGNNEDEKKYDHAPNADASEKGLSEMVHDFFNALSPSNECDSPVFQSARSATSSEYPNIDTQLLDLAVDILVHEELKDYYTTRAKQFNGKSRQEKIQWISRFIPKCAGKMIKSAMKKAEQQKAAIDDKNLLKNIIINNVQTKQNWRNNHTFSDYEWYDEQQEQRYYTNGQGEVQGIPREAPPRPSNDHEWNVFSQQWIVRMPYNGEDLFI